MESILREEINFFLHRAEHRYLCYSLNLVKYGMIFPSDIFFSFLCFRKVYACHRKPLRIADSQQTRYVGIRCNMASAEIILLVKFYISFKQGLVYSFLLSILQR